MRPALSVVTPEARPAHAARPAPADGRPRACPRSDPAAGGFARDFVHALTHRPHQISPKYFYDARGSRLFDLICELPEYYPTRTELDILKRHAPEMAARMPPGAELIEFGAGSLQKAGLLLRAMRAPARFVPIDISGEHLFASAAAMRQGLAMELPHLRIDPLVADFSSGLPMPPAVRGAGAPRYGFFPGSTIGNFLPDEALRFLRMAADLLRGGALLLGADLIKDPARLHAAYNDSMGVTAAFNLNLLARANRELDADFALEHFAHSAFYNVPQRRIEMHLMAMRAQQVRMCGQVFRLREGDSLHTENSYKFTIESLQALAIEAGFAPGPVWTDPERQFALLWLDVVNGLDCGSIAAWDVHRTPARQSKE